MRHEGQQYTVMGELQLGCDGPCSDDRQARDLAPMHHAVVKDKWRLGAERPEESRQSHGRSTWCMIRARVYGGWDGDEDGVGQIKEEGDGMLERLKALKLGGGWTGVDIVADLSVWASKPEAPLVQMNGGDGCTWRRLEACIKMKQKSWRRRVRPVLR